MIRKINRYIAGLEEKTHKTRYEEGLRDGAKAVRAIIELAIEEGGCTKKPSEDLAEDGEEVVLDWIPVEGDKQTFVCPHCKQAVFTLTSAGSLTGRHPSTKIRMVREHMRDQGYIFCPVCGKRNVPKKEGK